MWLGKRLFDFVFASFGLIVLAPVFVIVAILIKLDSKGPVFFRQERVGRYQKNFRIHKFRTMTVDAPKKGLQITVGHDLRITAFGNILRKYKIDELPQLIDVIVGNMSLVGPRPEVPYYVSKYSSDARNKIFQMRPGITDWAAIKFKDENQMLANSENPEMTYINQILPIKIKYYLEYCEKSSFATDVKIVLSTLYEIFVKH